MKYIQLMDCTMRDGGWVNEFSFGTEGMRDILQTVEDAGVEFVELGYLDQVKGFFHEGSMYKNLRALSESFSGVERREGTTRLVMRYWTEVISCLFSLWWHHVILMMM